MLERLGQMISGSEAPRKSANPRYRISSKEKIKRSRIKRLNRLHNKVKN